MCNLLSVGYNKHLLSTVTWLQDAFSWLLPRPSRAPLRHAVEGVHVPRKALGLGGGLHYCNGALALERDHRIALHRCLHTFRITLVRCAVTYLSGHLNSLFGFYFQQCVVNLPFFGIQIFSFNQTRLAGASSDRVHSGVHT